MNNDGSIYKSYLSGKGFKLRVQIYVNLLLILVWYVDKTEDI